MWIPDKFIKRILDRASVEFSGIHEVQGWSHYIAVYRIDHHKITFKVRSKNPKEATLNKMLLNELGKRLREIDLCIDESWSNYCTITRKDPWSLYGLIEKYINKQYSDLPIKAS